VDTFSTALDAVQRLAPEGPLALARPQRVAAAATWFVDRFPGDVLYAVKANPSPWVLQALYASGVTHFDVASEVEARLVRDMFPDATICFMHPVKSRRAIRVAYGELGVRVFVLDSVEELEKILAETNGAKDLTLIVRLAVSNEGSSMPLTSKFGTTGHDALELLRLARAATEEDLGVSFHVGSQCMRPTAFRAALADVARLIVRAGVTVDIVDVGGGFPSIYPGMTPPPMMDYVTEIERAFDSMPVTYNCRLWCEPGRALVAEAGSIVARVELRKGNALYLNDGAYGNLFDATHVKWPYPVAHVPASGTPSASRLIPFSFYGPTCDSMDAMVGPFHLPADIAEGDWIEIGMLGAYGTAMATKFNGFGDTETVMVSDRPWPSMFDDVAPAREQTATITRLSRSRDING